MRRNCATLSLAVAVVGLLAGLCEASPFVIDDFESGGPISIATSTTWYQTVGNLPVPSGYRELYAFNYSYAGQTTLSLPSTQGDDSLTVAGGQSGQNRGSCAVSWHRDQHDPYGGMQLDVTALGDRFYIRLSADPGRDAQLSIMLQDNHAGYGGPGRQNLNGSGYYEIPFSAFKQAFPGLDLTKISGFGLETDFTGAQATVAITEWGIVPEPATLSCLALAALALIHPRRKEGLR